MRANKTISIVILSLICFVQMSSAQTSKFGGKGLFRTLSAETVGTGNLYVNGYFSSYVQKAEENILAKDHSLSVGVTFGFMKHLETSLNIVPYQDDQHSIWGPPGNTRLGLKYHLPFSSPGFHIGLNQFFVFPTAQTDNIAFEPFSSGKVAWGSQLLMTMSLENMMPMMPIKIHANIGYLDHDMGDLFFKSEIDQMLIGLGVVFPIRSFQLFTEYSAEVFINEASVDFSQNSMRLTQGFKFLGPKAIIFDVIFDLGLTNNDLLETVKAAQDSISPFLKEYADWKFTIGATYRFSFKKLFDKSEKVERKKEDEEKRKLQRIQRKRENAAKDLESMKQILDRNVKEKDKDKKKDE